jgi:hypothetical protein
MFKTTIIVQAIESDNGVIVEAENFFNGTSQMELNITLPEFVQCFEVWKVEGKKIQDAFPKLSVVEREFLLTGMTAEQQQKTFKPRPDEHKVRRCQNIAWRTGNDNRIYFLA